MPPQQATAKQIAAAIYRYAKEQDWPSIVLNAAPSVEREVLQMAKDDGLLEWIEDACDKIRGEFVPKPTTAYRSTTAPVEHVVTNDLDEPSMVGVNL